MRLINSPSMSVYVLRHQITCTSSIHLKSCVVTIVTLTQCNGTRLRRSAQSTSRILPYVGIQCNSRRPAQIRETCVVSLPREMEYTALAYRKPTCYASLRVSFDLQRYAKRLNMSKIFWLGLCAFFVSFRFHIQIFIQIGSLSFPQECTKLRKT